MERNNKFSASESSLGYLYQIRYALYLAVSNIDSDISIETLDDVVLEDKTQSTLHQLKHHIKPGNLTDRSPDIWRSIRIWAELICSNQIAIADTQFLLVTTSNIEQNSLASLLVPDISKGRNPAEAHLRLKSIAEEQSNIGNNAAYKAFKSLSEEQQRRLLEKVVILDGALQITQLDTEIKRKFKIAVPDKFMDDFCQRVEGWWYDRVIKSLVSRLDTYIRSNQIRNKLFELESLYHDDNLPIDFVDLTPPAEEGLPITQRVFIEQLRLVMLSKPRISRAIADYYKAYRQRSKWLNDGNLLIGELSKYENRLIDEWNLAFLKLKEKLEGIEDDKVQAIAGRSLFDELESRSDLSIRRLCDQPYVMRGTYHQLANGMKVGWHPDFVDRLKALIQSAEGHVNE